VAEGAGEDVEFDLDGVGAAVEFLDDQFLRLAVARGGELCVEKDLCQLVSDRMDSFSCAAHFREPFNAEGVPRGDGENPQRIMNYEL